MEDPGVRHLTVDLHHHLELFVPDDAVCGSRKKRRVVTHGCFMFK